MNPEDLTHSAEEGVTNADNPEDIAKDVEKKREELILLANDGEIKKSEAYIRKANAKNILKMHTDYERERVERKAVFSVLVFWVV